CAFGRSALFDGQVLEWLRRRSQAGSARLQLRRIDDDVPDALTLPGVGDVDQAIRRLDHSRVRELARLLLQDQDILPALAVLRHGHAERAATDPRWVVDEQMTAVRQRHSIDA